MKRSNIGFCTRGENLLSSLVSGWKIQKLYHRDMPLQTFLSDPAGKKFRPDQSEKEKIKKYIADQKRRLYIHCSFTSYPWIGKGSAESRQKRLMEEILFSAEIGAIGLIIHTGKNCINQVCDLLRFIQSSAGSLLNGFTIYFEIHAGVKSESTLETGEKIRQFFGVVDLVECSFTVGFCIDTAHLHSIGVSLRSREDAEKWFNDLPHIPLLVHLNVSRAVAGRGKDIHELLCVGSIWKFYHPRDGIFSLEDSGLKFILEWCEARGVDCILERSPRGTISDLQFLSEENLL